MLLWLRSAPSVIPRCQVSLLRRQPRWGEGRGNVPVPAGAAQPWILRSETVTSAIVCTDSLTAVLYGPD